MLSVTFAATSPSVLTGQPNPEDGYRSSEKVSSILMLNLVELNDTAGGFSVALLLLSPYTCGRVHVALSTHAAILVSFHSFS